MMSPNEIVLPASLLLGLACLLCGIVVAVLLKQTRHIHYVILIGVIMAGVQAVLAYYELITLSGFLAGLSGILVGLLLKRNHEELPRDKRIQTLFHSTLAVYFGLSVLLIIAFWPGPLRTTLQSIAWVPQFQQVVTNNGFITPPGTGQAFKLFGHPGFYVFIVSIITTIIFNKRDFLPKTNLKLAFENTWKTAAPASLAILSTIVLSSVMEHAGLTQMLAKGLSNLFNNVYPVASPMVGMLGAFATGSNTSSNVIFGGMQKEIATFLQFSPAWMVAAQTTGGALGSMLSPAKIVLGSSTVGLLGKEGSVLKITLPIGIGISLLIGLVVLLLGS